MKGIHNNPGKAWWIYLLAGLLAVGGYLLLPTLAAHDIAYDLIGISTVAAILAGICINHPKHPLPWLLLALGVLLAVAGDSIWTFYEVVLGLPSPYPSVADALYLASYPTVAAGLILLIGWKGLRDWSALVDPLVVATGAGLISWVFLMKPYAEDTSVSLLERLVSVSYPLMDVLLIAVIARMLMAPKRRSPDFYFLTLAITFSLIADTVYSVAILAGTYSLGDPVDAGWLLYYVLFGTAALHPSMADSTETESQQEEGLTWRRLALLTVAALMAPAVLAIEAARGESISVPVIVGGSTVMFGLVISRAAVAMRAREQALRQEKVLRKAGEALVAAPDRESVYRASLEAALGLTGGRPGAGASFAVGSAREMTIEAVAGEHQRAMEGLSINVENLPVSIQQSLSGRVPVELKNVELASLWKVFGDLMAHEPLGIRGDIIRSLLVLPVYVRSEATAAVAITSPASFPEDVRESLELLANDISLTLESASLGEELNRSKAEAWFRSLIQNSSDIITILDPDGLIRYASPSAHRVLGLAPEALTGTNVLDHVHPEEAGRILAAFDRITDTMGPVTGGEIRFRHTDGSWRWLETTINDLTGDPSVRGVVANSRDVTERVEAAEALREAETRSRSLIENIPAVTYIHPAGESENLSYMSPQIESLLGYTVEEYTRDGFWMERLHPDDRERVVAEDKRSDDTLEPFSIEYRLKSREGHYVWLREESVVVHDEVGEPRFWQGFLWDISDRKEAEERLREAENRYRTLIENIPAVTYIQPVGDSESPTEDMTYISPQATNILGYTPEERLAKTEGSWLDMLHPDDRERVVAEDERTNRTGEPFSVEYRRRVRGGEYIWVRDESALMREENGEPLYWQGFLWDITERKEAEERLIETEAKYRTMVERVPAITYVHAQNPGESSVTSYISPQIETVLGYKPEEYASDPEFWKTLLHPDDRERVVAEDERTGETGEPFSTEFRMIARDGRTVWLREEGKLVRGEYGGHQSWHGVMFDITEIKQTEAKLRESEERYRLVAKATNEAIWDCDLASDRQTWSGAVERMFGYSQNSVTDAAWWESRVHPGDRSRVVSSINAVLEGAGEAWFEEYRFLKADGTYAAVVDRAHILRDEAGKPVRAIGSMMNVTERRNAEAKLREAELLYRTLIEQIPVTTYMQEIDHSNATFYISPQVEDLLGYTPVEYTSGPDLWINVLHPEDRERVLSEDERTDRTGEPFEREYRMIHRNGRVVWVRDEAIIVEDAEGRPLHWRGVMLDITERKELESRLSYQAYHDELTGLPNRALFTERLEHALARSDRREDSVAVLFMDLDNFKFVNDSFGHEAGDMLLVEMARRIKRCIRPGDTASRLGGDEFTVLIEDLEDPIGAAQAATRILQELEAPFYLENHELDITASIGIAFGGSSHDSPSGLLRDADVALYRAKSRGKAGYAVFDEAMNHQTEKRLKIESDLRRAVERGEFVVHYQPKLELSTGQVAGWEALVRWDHPRRGLLLPAEFIPLAEETGLIMPIGWWVLREACRQAKRWQEQHPASPPQTISVNLSTRQIQRPELAGEVARVLRDTRLDPGALVLEITESAVMESLENNARTLRSLKELGVKIAIDDFGTGYSGLAYLKNLPVDMLKVDKTFVEELDTSIEATAIVETIISLAHTLGLAVVAEGIESASQAERLRELGCELGQGYHFAYPMPEHEIKSYGTLLAAFHMNER